MTLATPILVDRMLPAVMEYAPTMNVLSTMTVLVTALVSIESALIHV